MTTTRVIGRSAEQAALEAAWHRSTAGDPQLVALWGRRRVGKTYLLSHFAQSRRAVYFTATRQDAESRQLERFTEQLREQLAADVTDLLPASFPNWETALRFVVRLAVTEPLLVVLDEAPRLTSERGDFGDLVSAIWENNVGDSKLMLVLSGSAVSVMDHMLGPQGGLHRRPTVELRMDPFTFHAAAAFQPGLSADDFVQAYAACGGYPLHLLQWSRDRTVKENLARMAFSPGGLLLRDAPDILSEDLDWRGGYERVLGAIAGGARRRSRIAGRAQQRIEYTLDRLRRAGYVHVVRPIGQGAGADPQYEIDDTYLAFWFAVLRDDADLIEGGQGGAIQHRTFEQWQRHVAGVFEASARDQVTRMVQAGDLPPGTIVGRWWRDETAEVDVLALDDDTPVLIGECKWRERPLDDSVLAKLRSKVPHIGDADATPTFALWSRGGVTDAVQQHPDVRSFVPADLLL